MNLESTALMQNPFVSLLFNNLKEKYRLTRRESEVLQLLMLNGSTNRELGANLYLSEKTLKNHVASIQRKFEVNSSREVQAVVLRSIASNILEHACTDA
jgi:DNA-binding CsgD family transcriptional regulator